MHVLLVSYEVRKEGKRVALPIGSIVEDLPEGDVALLKRTEGIREPTEAEVALYEKQKAIGKKAEKSVEPDDEDGKTETKAKPAAARAKAKKDEDLA